MKDVIVTLPTMAPPPETTLDKKIEHEEDHIPIEKATPEQKEKDELTIQVVDQPDEETQQLIRDKRIEASDQKTFHEPQDEILKLLNAIDEQKEEILKHRKTI